MTFKQMEQHYQLLQVIEQYESLLAQYDTGLKAVSMDGMPKSSNCPIDRVGNLLIKRELAIEKLQHLQSLAAAKRPEVLATISVATAGSGKKKIRMELIFRMRYIDGHTWVEISDTLGSPAHRLEDMIRNGLSKIGE